VNIVKKIWEVVSLKRIIAKTLVMSLVLSFAIVYSPTTLKVDVVSAATNTTTGTPTPTTTPKPTTTTPVPTIKDGSKVYVVVSGDMMWKIAKKHNLTLDQLKSLNPQVKNANRIYVGQKLIVGQAVAIPTTPTTPTTPTVVTAKKLFHGFGEVANYRLRGTGNLNITTASVIFDENGKIVDLTWDVMEITTTLFPGWHDATADTAAQAAFKASIDNKFETKREEGYNYDMTHLKSKGVADNLTKKEWFEQLNYFESFFKGMTVAEVEAWAGKYTDASKRPFKFAYPEKLTDADKAATANFTAKEKDMLVDVTTSATMSLQDDHSFFLTALKEAYEAREEIK
jgi:LysM repeat protein